jgi:hypothetical protein
MYLFDVWHPCCMMVLRTPSSGHALIPYVYMGGNGAIFHRKTGEAMCSRVMNGLSFRRTQYKERKIN